MKHLPKALFLKAQDNIAFTNQAIIQAQNRIEEKYHDFLILLPQNIKLTTASFDLTAEQSQLGMYCTDKGTYIPVEKPYVTVDGRLRMARDEHLAAGKLLNIHPVVFQTIGDIHVISVTIDSEIHGTTTGTSEVSFSGAVDSSNPISNAQTSAIGRALGFMGYGIVGTGLITKTDVPSQVAGTNEQTLINSTNRTQNSKLPPRIHRVLIVEAVKFNSDNSSIVKIKRETQSICTLTMPKEIAEFARSLQFNQVIKVKGWLNTEGTRLNATKDIPVIEQKAI
ncbi:hypothetical protein [Viridibacillus arvi]|uniref:hypothetical protein n=1 Tax=Viridibacillus arvi TaxID=263475 RepID=UPI0034CF2994